MLHDPKSCLQRPVPECRRRDLHCCQPSIPRPHWLDQDRTQYSFIHHGHPHQAHFLVERNPD
ncbi:hypothetical protein HIM_04796 [Hirsutella minnesotensis 3608]|uniref:Uncharacterized protein n=1 Tax=Hirsutella minnesotensis 3608 TaxID=1043627 RepID=A0A0F8A179_9HYPO|nr:hypothetical protein HIM_04796 [Hirsutella minnesotensis 3608]